MCGSRGEGGTGGPDPPSKITKIFFFFSNTGPDPLKIVKLPSQLLILNHKWHVSKHYLNGVSLAGQRWPANSGIWIIPPP